MPLCSPMQLWLDGCSDGSWQPPTRQRSSTQIVSNQQVGLKECIRNVFATSWHHSTTCDGAHDSKVLLGAILQRLNSHDGQLGYCLRQREWDWLGLGQLSMCLLVRSSKMLSIDPILGSDQIQRFRILCTSYLMYIIGAYIIFSSPGFSYPSFLILVPWCLSYICLISSDLISKDLHPTLSHPLIY